MGLVVDISSQEAESKAFDDLPSGKYNCVITDVSIEESKSAANAGKPYYHFEFTIQDGKYENQHIWANAMLWSGALYTIVNILKALGEDVQEGKLEIPDAEWFVSKPVIVRMAMGKASKGADGTEYPARVEAKGFFPIDGKASPAAQAKAGSLLP
jgi:hypothetical protein